MYESSIHRFRNARLKTHCRLLTNKVALLIRLDPSFSHGLFEHLDMRLAVELVRAIVTVSNALEEIVDLQQFDDALAVRDVRVGE